MSKSTRSRGFATRAIHEGYDPADHDYALVPPVHFSSTFTFEDAQHGGDLFAGVRDGHFYSRISNPTLDLLERRLAALEGAEAGLVTASGMGAITATFWTFIEPGAEVVMDETLYGCTFAFLRSGLAKFGIKVTPVDLREPENLEKVLTDQTRIVYFETPANPNMRLVDIARVSEIAHTKGARVIVDNTYATPYLQNPLALGADLVIHSATKYLGGHGDLVAGAVVGSAEDIQRIRLEGLKDMTGAVMSPFSAMLIMRGLKTLELRMDRHVKAAKVIADMLEAHPMVERVSYPGLESYPQYALAQAQMAQPGGMMAFELKGGMLMGRKFIDSVSLVQRAVSLGDPETLVQHPATMTHSAYTPEERARHGISDGLIRLSAGLETIEDILEDLTRALDACKGPRLSQVS
ncbi:MAG: methionine gamma-lyase [Alphaproteobacteria bacterium]|nr:MAG: methionine gamma-lyase [Alphaproteobacteria bacterium]